MSAELVEAVVIGDTRLTETFWAKVEVDLDTGCWNWTAAKYKNGYGAYGVPASQRPKGKYRIRLAHRFAYERLVGDPGEKVLDHTCHTEDCKLVFDCPHRACVNPQHLKPSTHRENLLRSDTETRKNANKTHCVNGHEYTEANTYFYRNARSCRACALPRMRKYNKTHPKKRRSNQ